jgi:hypothetical protein
MGRLQDTLSTVAVTLAVAYAAVLSIGIARVSLSAGAPPPSHHVGDVMAPLPGFDYTDHPLTVIMPVSPNCRSCDRTWRLYQHVAAFVAGYEQVRLVWASPLEQDVTMAFISGQGLPRGRILKVKPVLLRIRALPTVLVVDSTGTIRGLWAGRDAFAREEEILRHLRRITELVGPSASTR